MNDCDDIVYQRVERVRSHVEGILTKRLLTYELSDCYNGGSKPVELQIDIPKQIKLPFRLCIMLQNEDELWLIINGVTTSRFPFDTVVDEFLEDVDFLLSSVCRLSELRVARTNRIVGGKVELLKNGEWTTIGHYSTLRAIWPFGLETRRDMFRPSTVNEQ